MRVRRDVGWGAACGLALFALAAAGTSPWGRARVVGWRLGRAAGPKEAAEFVRRSLASDTGATRAAVADYAARSPLRAFDPEHGIFLEHDAATGETYVAVRAEAVRVERAGGPPLTPAERERLEQEIGGAVHLDWASFSIGQPPLVCRGVRLLGGGRDDGAPGPATVSFLLRERVGARCYRVAFEVEAGRCGSQSLFDVSDAERRAWRASGDWPPDWD